MPTPRSIPWRSRSGFVTKRSSPTSWTRSPSSLVSCAHAVPVVFGEAVLDRDDRVALDELGPERRHRRALELAALEAVGAVAEDLARRRVERDRDAVAVPGPLGRLEDRLDRGLARLEVGREAALVADPGREPAFAQDALELVVDLDADPQALGEARGAHGHDHELLQVDRVGGVGAAVDHVQHRHGERRRLLAAEMAVERLAGLGGSRLCGRERDAEDRVRAEASFVRRSVEVDQLPVERLLVEPVEAGELACDLAVHVRDRFRHALAAPLGAAVAQLDRLVHAGRGAGGHRGAAERAGGELDVDLDGRVAARVEDLAAVQALDRAHPSCSFAWS